MAKKLSYDQIAERQLFDPLVKEIDELNKKLDQTAEKLKGVAQANAEIAKQTPLDGYDNIQKVEKAVDDTAKAVKELSKVEKDRVRLQERLNALNDERAKDNAALRLEIQKRTRELKEEARLTSQTATQYEKMDVRLRALRKEYKQVRLEQGKWSKASRQLRKEITGIAKTLEDVDEEMGQQFRKIGRYTEAVKKLRGAFIKLGAATGIIKLLELAVDAFRANRESADAFAKVFGRVTVTLSVFVSRVVRIFPAIGNIFEQIQIKFERFILVAQRGLANLPELLGGSVDKVDELDKKIAALDSRAQSLAGNGLSAVTSAFDGMGEEIADLIEKNDKLIDQTTQFEEQAIQLRRELADLVKTQGLLQVAADDDTQSMRDMEAAALDLLKVNAEIADKNTEIARNELARARAAADVRVGDLEAQKEYAEAYVASQEAVAEAAISAAEVKAQIRKIERDQLEAELDILFDVSDRRKTVGEQQLADERTNLERRKQILSDTVTDIEATYSEITNLINQFSDEAIDIDALLSIEDTVELNRAINELDIDEITRNRLREALIERLQAVEDLNVARKDLLDTENEYRKVVADIAIQEELLADIEAGRLDALTVLDELETRRRELSIENLRAEIKSAEEGSTRRAELQQELNDILLEQQQEAAEKAAEEAEKARQSELDKDKKAAEERLKIQEELYGLLSDLSEGYFDRQEEQLDEQLEQSQERESQLREAATQGIQDATNSLAVEQQRQAEIEAQRAEVEKRKRLAELALTALEIYQSKVAAGDGNALASTIADVSLLRSFIGSLQGFYEGSERVGDDLKAVMPGRDGHIVRVDGGERIVSSRENALIPRGMSNLQLAMIAHNAERLDRVAGPMDIAPLRADLKAVKDAIENKPAYMGLDFDANKGAIISTVVKRGKRIRTHRRVGGVFGG